MLSKEERKGFVIAEYNSGKQIQYIHNCKDCGEKMYKTSQEEKVSKGYCKNCFFKHRSVKLENYNKLGEKWCKGCLRFLEVKLFTSKNIGHSTLCNKCHNYKKFGISALDFEKLVELQNNKCAICGNPETANDKNKKTVRALAVDHCHNSNKVRGLLCTNCNILLGHSKDDISILKKAIKYLEDHQKFT